MVQTSSPRIFPSKPSETQYSFNSLFPFHQTIQSPIHQTIKPRVFPRFVYSKKHHAQVGEDGASSSPGARRGTRRAGRIGRRRGKCISCSAKQLGAAEAADRNARGPSSTKMGRFCQIFLGMKIDLKQESRRPIKLVFTYPQWEATHTSRNMG